MSRNVRLHTICVRLPQIAIAATLSLSLAACTCPPPLELDQVFLLDATTGSFSDASLADGSSADGATLADGGATSTTRPGQLSSLDCTPAAAGCVPGSACRPVCDCVLARDGVRTDGVIKSCTLLAGTGPLEVEVRYEQTVFCGGF